jgi:ribosomal protein S18 acetylase RimI-like enzyme
MPRTEDPAVLRKILNTDRHWAVYALGDLDLRRFAQCEWFHTNSAVVLLYRAPVTPVLFAMGPPEDVGRLLAEAGPPRQVSVHVKPDILPFLQQHYSTVHAQPVLRMALQEPMLVEDNIAQQLTAADLAPLDRLYSDGCVTGESPDFFLPSMLEDGGFFGVWEDNELVAAAGTHLVALNERVAAVGNVYTRRDHRGRGLGASVTSAVVRSLLGRGIDTISLSVREANGSAIGVYQRIGFVRHCLFVDGPASCVIS